METSAPSSSSTSNRATFACTRCAGRKVKCDRQRPCSACVKHNVDCRFNPVQPPRKRYKRVNIQVLTDRLKHCEALLQEQGVDPSKLPDTPSSEQFDQHHKPSQAAPVVPNTPSSIDSPPNRSINKTQVVHEKGRSQFVDNSLWTRMVEEFHDPEDALEDSSNDASDLEASDEDLGFVLATRPKPSARSRHPSPEQMYQLWQIYTENFDPLTKIVHVPTLQPAIQRAASNTEAIPRGFEALMFAIYSAAILTMKDDECRQRFCEPRKTLLSRYISATKAALSRAKFMATSSLIVLQALLVHLISVRDIYAPRAVWSLTGVAVRIAQGMGLERDGVSLGLPPFEAEMRRRVWHLLMTHDFRTAELCGLSKFRDLDTTIEGTKPPTNVNDDQLYPGMPSLPPESNGLTDIVFIALRSEFSRFAARNVARFRKQGKSSSQFELNASGADRVEIDDSFKEVEQTLETKYIRFCDPSQPLHLMVMLAGRAAMNVVRFLTHHPRRWASIEQTPLSERQFVWEVSVKLLEQHHMLQTNQMLRPFAWHAAYFLPWHAFIHVLDTLRANPVTTDAEKAWQLISNIYDSTPDMILDTRMPVHVAVGNLCLKAYSAREAALQNGNRYRLPTPAFISQLRQQREVAKAKKQARDVKSGQPHGLVSQSQANNDGMNTIYPNDPSGTTQSIALPLPSVPQTGGITEGDPFWFMNGFDDSQFGNLNNVINMDPDFMLAQDHSMGDNASPSITWAQWDAWLADSSVVHPLASVPPTS